MIYRVLLLMMLVQSCVSTSVFEDAQALGEGNSTIQGAINTAPVQVPEASPDAFSALYDKRNVGSFHFNYIKGLDENTNVGIGIDLPLGLNVHIKQLIYSGKLQHLHALKLNVHLPLVNLFEDEDEVPIFALQPSYIYTYRHDDLISASINAHWMSVQTIDRLTHIPGVAAGIHVGDEIRFSAGVAYFNNFSAFGATGIQYLSVEASIKYDL